VSCSTYKPACQKPRLFTSIREIIHDSKVDQENFMSLLICAFVVRPGVNGWLYLEGRGFFSTKLHFVRDNLFVLMASTYGRPAYNTTWCLNSCETWFNCDTNVYYFSTIVDCMDNDLRSGSAYMQILCHVRGQMPIVPLHLDKLCVCLVWPVCCTMQFSGKCSPNFYASKSLSRITGSL